LKPFSQSVKLLLVPSPLSKFWVATQGVMFSLKIFLIFFYFTHFLNLRL
jgi:hypothetical protein